MRGILPIPFPAFITPPAPATLTADGDADSIRATLLAWFLPALISVRHIFSPARFFRTRMSVTVFPVRSVQTHILPALTTLVLSLWPMLAT